MQVALIYYTGMGMADPLWAARHLIYTKDTRLQQGEVSRAKVAAMTGLEVEEQLKYIASTIRSSWEFIDYHFEISGVTRAFTHQFVRTRTGSYAQQSQRSVFLEDFTVTMPESIKGAPGLGSVWTEVIEKIREGYGKLYAAHISAQDCRGLLPTNVQTNIIAKFNLRTMADLLAKRKNLRAQGEYANVAKAMEAAIYKVHPWAHGFLAPDRTATPELDALLAASLGSASPVDKPKLNAALKELDGLKATWG